MGVCDRSTGLCHCSPHFTGTPFTNNIEATFTKPKFYSSLGRCSLSDQGLCKGSHHRYCRITYCTFERVDMSYVFHQLGEACSGHGSCVNMNRFFLSYGLSYGNVTDGYLDQGWRVEQLVILLMEVSALFRRNYRYTFSE